MDKLTEAQSEQAAEIIDVLRPRLTDVFKHARIVHFKALHRCVHQSDEGKGARRPVTMVAIEALIADGHLRRSDEGADLFELSQPVTAEEAARVASEAPATP